MRITIPLRAELSPEELTEVLHASKKPYKAFYCKELKLRNNGKLRKYLFTTFNRNGDCELCIADLSRISLVSNEYKVTKVQVLDTFETQWEALQSYNKIAPVSHSGGRPLQAINFPLSMIGLQANPNLEQILYNWGQQQEIIPIYYCTYNPRNDSIELSLQDPNARNSSARMRVIEQGVFTELKHYLEKHPEVGSYDKEAMEQVLDPNYLDMRPSNTFREMGQQG